MKPDPKSYRMALEQVKAQAGEAVFVDDAAENVEGARSVGMQGIFFQNQAGTLAKLKELLK